MKLNTRKIGQHDVSEIGYGTMGLSAYYGKAKPDEESFQVLDAALNEGCTFWDTADIYGDSEDLLGRWFKRTGNRDKIFLATKFGITPEGTNGTPEYVRSAFEKSLKRLGVEIVDLYYLHRADKNVPIEVTVKAMAELVKEGKVRYLGLSEISANTLRRAHAIHPIAAVQVEYSPFSLDIEDEKIGLLNACRELGVTIVAYSPLGRGLLTGSFKSNADIPADDWRKNIPRFSDSNFPNVLKLVKGLQDIGSRRNCTSGQISLAWILAQGNDFITIPGTTRITSLKENLAAANIQLTAEEIEEVREVAKMAGASQVDRYPPSLMDTLFADTPEL